MKPISLLLPLLLSPLLLIGQFSLEEDREFFESSSWKYQDWLENTGLGQVLKVHTIRVEPQKVTLYLAFHQEEPNRCWEQWRLLDQMMKQQWQQSLEERLFYTMTVLFNLPGTAASIQVYNTYNLNRRPCFYKGITQPGERIEVVADRCRIKSIRPEEDLEDLDLRSALVFNPDLSLPNTQFLDYVIDYFRRQRLYGGRLRHVSLHPELTILERSADHLLLKVANLPRTVLASDRNPDFCMYFDCNSIQTEQLLFRFEQTEAGWQVRVEGWFTTEGGSGYGRSARHFMDHSFNRDINNYTLAFCHQINDYINEQERDEFIVKGVVGLDRRPWKWRRYHERIFPFKEPWPAPNVRRICKNSINLRLNF